VNQYYEKIIKICNELESHEWEEKVFEIEQVAKEGIKAENNKQAWNIHGHYFSPCEVASLKERGIDRNCMEKRLLRGASKSYAMQQPKQKRKVRKNV
jgi:hypothetical protein